MIATERYSAAEVEKVEAGILQRDYSMFRPYANDAVRFHLSNRQELERRKRFLAKHADGTDEGVFCFALLCVLTDDHKGWDIAIRFFKGKPNPSLGHVAYEFLVSQGAGPERLAEWKKLLELSASQGHLQSKRMLFEKRAESFGPLRRPVLFFYRIWISVQFLTLLLKNRNDPRLPYDKTGARQSPWRGR